jgi:mono/diheme cytochrome c family protein
LLPQSSLTGSFTARGSLRLELDVVAQEDPVMLTASETGRSAKGFLARAPLAVDAQVIARGEERYNIYCSPCHDRAGTAQGVIPQRGFPGPVDLSSSNTRGLTDGQIFDIIARGIRNMPAMKGQVPAADRWPIVTYVRVLQRSQSAKIADVEPQFRDAVLPEEAEP